MTKLRIQNLRTIREATIDFATPPMPHSKPAEGDEPHRNVTVLLGNNGAGKTTVLKAIALAAVNHLLIGGSGFVPYSLVRRVGDKAEPSAIVKGNFALYQPQDGPRSSVDLEIILQPRTGFTDLLKQVSGGDNLWKETLGDDRSPAALVVGYGADRRIDSQDTASIEARYKRRALRYARVAGLFEESVSLVPLSAWLPRFKHENPGRHRQVISLINRVLPDMTIEPKPVDGEYHFSTRGSSLPLSALSDGYRAFIGWFADLLYHICLGAPSGHRLDETTGIALVDEVDLHLHPAWQREVVARVSSALPHMQFIFTTHSPLVVGSLRAENVLVLSDVELPGGVRETRVDRPTAETFGLGAEQLLTGDTFGLDSTRAPAFTEKMREASRQARSGDPDAVVQFLRLAALGEAGEAPGKPAKAVPEKPPAKTKKAKATTQTRKTKAKKPPRRAAKKPEPKR